ncbi:MAB_1171c family putative transporter [Streptomyces specialis]|uniref:MAB_1171c family putative transporter n=1 Tax=Streptomyces specialis TaxID=498367 RepID=UPI000AAADF3B|nr:MAB_1171c family putative transporter [Streptomyces specialis]
MVNVFFLATAVALAVAAGYWVFGRGTPRPAGTWAMGAVLISFAGAFASYTPMVAGAIEAVVPQSARLLSNSFSLAAATSVLIFMLQLGFDPEEAGRRTRPRLLLLAVGVSAMTLLFLVELATQSPQVYGLYILVYITFLTLAVKDFLHEVWRQSMSAKRFSLRIGLRLTAAGCVFALIYAAYKVIATVAVVLGTHLVPDHHGCTSLVSSPCVFSATAPGLAVLLITVGLTLPAVTWPIGQALRRRWEAASFRALGPLWQDLSSATPEIVLSSSADADGEHPDDLDFLLHRRVIEINDGILALRPYRSEAVRESAYRAVVVSGKAGTEAGEAMVEATVLQAAVRAKRAGRPVGDETPLPASAIVSRAGDLRAETRWLLRLAHAYADTATRLAANEPLRQRKFENS